MDLVIDIGNTSCKAAIFKQDRMILSEHWEEQGSSIITSWIRTYPEICKAIISSVKKDDAGLKAELEKAGIQVITLDEKTALPLENRYGSPETLGRDRLAAAAGANAMFPGKNLLIIDAGTAITIDFVTSGNAYMGGNISPGMSMRFRSLNEFTDNLPLVKPARQKFHMGLTTEDAIRSGVQYGIIFELDEYINRQKFRYPDLHVILTGGDAMFFEKKLKNSIFVDPDLNLHGLHSILDYNVGR